MGCRPRAISYAPVTCQLYLAGDGARPVAAHEHALPGLQRGREAFRQVVHLHGSYMSVTSFRQEVHLWDMPQKINKCPIHVSYIYSAPAV